MNRIESEPGEAPGRVDEFSQRACEQLAILIRCLVEALHKFQHVEADVLSNSEEAHHLLEELKAQLHQAKNLVDRSYAMPWMYRIINAFQIRSEFRNVCHSLGLTLEGLHSLLSSEIDELKEELKQLEWAFRNAMFPLDSVELEVFKEARNISSEIYKATVTLPQGIGKLRKMLESTFGHDKVQGQWKQVAEHLYRDMDAARIKKDRMEEHYLRQLLWAVSGSDAPPEFYCPISLNVMEEPVVLFETAVTYDRKSLETWLFAYGSKKCPVSGRSLTDTAFVENRPLRSLIEEWKRAQTFGGVNPHEDLLQSASSRDVSRHWGSNLQSPDESPTDAYYQFPSSPAAESEDPMAFLESSLDNYKPAYPHKPAYVFKQSPHMDSHTSNGSGSVTRRRLKEKGIMIELMAASEEGDIQVVQELGESGWDLSHCDEGGRSCLHLASAYGHEDIVEYLLTKELNIHATTPNDNASPLYLAALGGHVGTVQVLLSYGADISGVNKHGWTALHAAADQGHGEVAKILLLHARKANLPCPQLRSVSGWTALHHAARCGGINTTMQMLHFYDDVNLKCEAGWTPLHVAVDNGHRDVVKLLLTSTNANPNIQSKDGWTSLHAAQDKNYLDIGRILLKYGADADIQSAEGVTALHRASFLNHLEFAQLIVSEGKADLNKKTKAGRKAIQIASELGHHEIYNFLFRKGLKRMFKSRS